MKRAVALFTAHLVLLVPLADKCDSDPNQKGPSGGKPATRKACDLRPHSPETAVLAGKAVVSATVEATCDKPPVSHKLKVWLEKKVDGTWTQQTIPGGDSSANCEEIPPSGSWIKCQFVLFTCSKGSWRTRALATGTGPSPANLPFSFSPDEKPSALIVCPKGK